MRLFKVYPRGRYGVAAYRLGLRVWHRFRKRFGRVLSFFHFGHRTRGAAEPAAPGRSLSFLLFRNRGGGVTEPAAPGKSLSYLLLREIQSARVFHGVFSALFALFLFRERGQGHSLPGRAGLAFGLLPLQDRNRIPGYHRGRPWRMQEILPLRELNRISGPHQGLPWQGADAFALGSADAGRLTEGTYCDPTAGRLAFGQEAPGLAAGQWVTVTRERLIIRQADQVTLADGRLVIQ